MPVDVLSSKNCNQQNWACKRGSEVVYRNKGENLPNGLRWKRALVSVVWQHTTLRRWAPNSLNHSVVNQCYLKKENRNCSQMRNVDTCWVFVTILESDFKSIWSLCWVVSLLLSLQGYAMISHLPQEKGIYLRIHTFYIPKLKNSHFSAIQITSHSLLFFKSLFRLLPMSYNFFLACSILCSLLVDLKPCCWFGPCWAEPSLRHLWLPVGQCAQCLICTPVSTHSDTFLNTVL